LYAASARADLVLSNAYAPMLSACVEEVRSALPASEVAGFFRAVGKSLGESPPEVRGPLPKRVAASSARGVEYRPADNAGGRVTPQSVLRLVDARTRVVALSHVEFWNGYRVDIQTIGQECRRRGVILAVDAIQSAGALQLEGQLLRVAAGLRKRKRVAWQIAVGAAFVMTLSHVFRGFRPGEAVISLLAIVNGSPAGAITIGMLLVACFAACAAGVDAVTMTSGARCTSSAARSGRRSTCPSA